APFINAEGYLVDDSSELVYKAAARVVPLLDKDAIIFVDWHNLYPYYYAAHIEQQRTDLRFVEMYTHTDTPGLPESVIEFILSEIDSHPIYFADRVAALEKAGFELRPTYFGFLRFYKVQASAGQTKTP
ncbi:MAG TPA: hypothetical protein VI547_12285, partial [Anaerolineales bacterium]|nr:hypothetical protein [Anaerolineales bacterium]